MTKKIIIIYATYSGSTFLVAESIAKILQKKYQVVMQKASDTFPDDLEKYDLIILGSPSWSIQGREAFPHEDMSTLMDECTGRKYAKKQFAAFGCGDSSYTLFCGAVNQLERFIADIKGEKIIESLRIDAYYFRLAENEELVRRWADKLLQKIK